MKQLLLFLSLVGILCTTALAQEERHEITVQGTGFFTNQTTGSGITNRPTYSGGLLAGFRLNINRWLAAEGDYDFFSNSQKYITSVASFNTQTYVHGVTGTAVIKLPGYRMVRPFALAGGGALVFDPRNTAQLDRQTRGAFVYGGGFDFSLIKHVAVRTQYRGFVYKNPDFNISQLQMDKFTHSAVPSAGLVLHW
jgi:opacity protein-like surface antigen